MTCVLTFLPFFYEKCVDKTRAINNRSPPAAPSTLRHLNPKPINSRSLQQKDHVIDPLKLESIENYSSESIVNLTETNPSVAMAPSPAAKTILVKSSDDKDTKNKSAAVKQDVVLEVVPKSPPPTVKNDFKTSEKDATFDKSRLNKPIKTQLANQTDDTTVGIQTKKTLKMNSDGVINLIKDDPLEKSTTSAAQLQTATITHQSNNDEPNFNKTETNKNHSPADAIKSTDVIVTQPQLDYSNFVRNAMLVVSHLTCHSN